MLGRKFDLQIGAGLVLTAIMLFGVSAVGAQGTSSIAQGFQTNDPNVVAGALVGLKAGTPNSVELSNSDSRDRIFGVVDKRALIELTNGVSSVQVVTSGSTALLVSDINGLVKTGDRITASPIAGVGMRATTSGVVVGTAQADLAKAATTAKTISNKDGEQQTVKIGALLVRVEKVYFEVAGDNSSFVPQALQSFANNVVGHAVSPARVLVAVALVALLIIVVGVLLYSAVKSSITAIGRNPLSGSLLRRSLLQVGVTVFGIMAFAVILVYLILVT